MTTMSYKMCIFAQQWNVDNFVEIVVSHLFCGRFYLVENVVK